MVCPTVLQMVRTCTLALFVESLSRYFSQFGAVKEAMVMRTREGQSRGFGFCVFNKKRVCQNVLKVKTHIIDNRRVLFS